MAEIYNPGYDTSGNENDWTPVNINYTTSTATTYDRVSDVPTLTDENTGNFATLNVINKPSSHTLSNGNLTTAITSIGGIDSTIGVSSGKWYCEVTLTTVGADTQLGVTNLTNGFVTAYLGQYTTSWGCITFNGNRIHNGSQSAYGSSFSNGDVGMIALDMDTGKWYCGKNGTWFNSGNPANGTNPAHTGLTGVMKFAIGSNSSSGNHSINFGQRPFAYTPPTGYKKLNTYNLPDSSIKDGSQYFDVDTWSGDSSATTQIATPFSPDFVWIKNRSNTGGSGAASHMLYDTVRGVQKELQTNLTDAEGTLSSGLNSFDSDGYKPGTSTRTNETGNTYVGWAWRASDSTAVTDPTTGAEYSANTTAGFSIVKYTGDGDTSASRPYIPHGLGVAPSMIIYKRTDATGNWVVTHKSLSSQSQSYLLLNSTAAVASSSPNTVQGSFNSLGFRPRWTDASSGNIINTAEYVAYVFAEVEGFSKFGSYEGNGSADGPFVYTGFRPAFVLFKNADDSRQWGIVDTSRSTYNQTNATLEPSTSNAENPYDDFDFLSNGFKPRTTDPGSNRSGYTIIYMAFAENPFKNSLAR